MKSLVVYFCLLLAVSARHKEKKTTLEDVEQDYITTQKRTKLSPPPSLKSTPAQSPTQFGFVPVKTVANYAQQEPRINYLPTTYIAQPNQQYSSQVSQQYSPQADYLQYATAQQYTGDISQKYSAISPQYTGPAQKYTLAKYSAQPSTAYAQQQNDYQNYENVQYIADNNIGQAAQQYYTPQYVYLQQYQAPSTSVQTIVDPKGGLQYVMYVPAYVPTTASDQTQNYENVAYTNGADTSANYQVPETPQYKTLQYHQKQPAQFAQTESDYIKREPKSLLDSYVPSILQLQYYRQTQQNSIQEPVKIPRAFSGKNTYRSASTAATSATNSYRPSSYKS